MNIHRITLEEALPIRHRVLWPDKPASFCRVEGDDSAIHYGALVDGRLVCVASIYVKCNEARLRKFATLPDFQGKGIGSKVIQHAMSELRLWNVEYFWCDARVTAQEFYRRYGFVAEGAEFEKSGVLYCKMSVRLTEQHRDKQ